MEVVTRQTWLPAKTAANRLGTTVYKLHNMALAGRIRYRSEPGSLPQFNAEDVERLRSESLATA